jgi:hypothetical protein
LSSRSTSGRVPALIVALIFNRHPSPFLTESTNAAMRGQRDGPRRNLRSHTSSSAMQRDGAL